MYQHRERGLASQSCAQATPTSAVSTYRAPVETDDNLITWGWADHVLEVRAGSVEEAMQAMGVDPSSLSAEQRTQFRTRIERQLANPQRVPMMRMMTHQPMSVLRVEAANRLGRNEFFRSD